MRKLLVEFLAFGLVSLLILAVSVAWNLISKRRHRKDDEKSS